MSSKLVCYEVDRRVALITLNRPKAMNAFNRELMAGIQQAQAKAELDDAVRIIVITGSGRAFSSGTDLNTFKDMTTSSGLFDNSIRDVKPLIDGITRSNKIYVAAINGFAGGVAVSLALACDLAIMADDALVFSPFADIGLVPDGGFSWHYLHAMGYKRAFAAIAESERLSAQTCYELGFVNKVVAAEQLQDKALKWAHTLSLRAPLSLRYTKKILHEIATVSREEAARVESEYQTKAANSDDSQAAVEAFINKEKPVFNGK